MTGFIGKLPSRHGQLTRIWLTDDCGGKTIKTTAQFEYDCHGFEGYLGNVGLINSGLDISSRGDQPPSRYSRNSVLISSGDTASFETVWPNAPSAYFSSPQLSPNGTAIAWKWIVLDARHGRHPLQITAVCLSKSFGNNGDDRESKDSSGLRSNAYSQAQTDRRESGPQGTPF